MHYDVVTMTSIDGLKKEVNSLIDKGYIPLGPPTITRIPETNHSYGYSKYYQAMLKEK